MMKSIVILFATGLAALTPGTAMAAPQAGGPPQSGSISPNHLTGQPQQSCEDLANQPGHTLNSPGSAFNPTGTSGGNYAGEKQGINDKNTASASQYDVACLHNQSPQQ